MKRGEICLVQLDPTIDREISKTRPAIIVNDDAIGILPLNGYGRDRKSPINVFILITKFSILNSPFLIPHVYLKCGPVIANPPSPR